MEFQTAQTLHRAKNNLPAGNILKVFFDRERGGCDFKPNLKVRTTLTRFFSRTVLGVEVEATSKHKPV